MKYCSQCGARISHRVPEDDDRPRFVCTSCATVFYENPKVVAGAIALREGKILFCRRAIEPRLGKWTLPAGYLENGETVEACARRETCEEAGGLLEDLRPYSLLNLPAFNQVYVIYLARLVNTDFGPGAESLETELFAPEEIPWKNLAFPVIARVLSLYCGDLSGEVFPFREVSDGLFFDQC